MLMQIDAVELLKILLFIGNKENFDNGIRRQELSNMPSLYLLGPYLAGSTRLTTVTIGRLPGSVINSDPETLHLRARIKSHPITHSHVTEARH